MNNSTKNILLKFDEIGRYETPSHFDYDSLKRKVIIFQSNLKKRFGYDFQIDDQVQDASFFCDLKIPKELVMNPSPNIGYTIRISNFGNLATINFQEEYSHEVRQGIIDQLRQDGFRFVDSDELDEAYDGKFNNFRKITPDYQPSWYMRYFDYL